MPQLSKLVHARAEWRAKAVKRSDENKELRKTLADHKQKIAALKDQLKASQEEIKGLKKNF
jgi:septal ring factor EnvC (AmiA/AmiB activator)